MTRIIAGALGSLRLKTAAKSTRPTSDRVKESIFAKLEAESLIEGAKVLDLFAGTGALGLEALSRGADSVFLVENDPGAFACMAENVRRAALGFRKHNELPRIQTRFEGAMTFLKKSTDRFDLVFLDPPYGLQDEKVSQFLKITAELLTDFGVIVLERSKRAEISQEGGLRILYRQSFGDTQVVVFCKIKVRMG